MRPAVGGSAGAGPLPGAGGTSAWAGGVWGPHWGSECMLGAGRVWRQRVWRAPPLPPLPAQPDPSLSERSRRGAGHRRSAELAKSCGLGALRAGPSHHRPSSLSQAGRSELPVPAASPPPSALKPGPSRTRCSAPTALGLAWPRGRRRFSLSLRALAGRPAVLRVRRGLPGPRAPAGCCHPGTGADPSRPPRRVLRTPPWCADGSSGLRSSAGPPVPSLQVPGPPAARGSPKPAGRAREGR